MRDARCANYIFFSPGYYIVRRSQTTKSNEMYYLIASNPTGEQRILDARPVQDGLLPMLAHHLKQTKGTLVDSIYDMNSEGVHIIEEEPEKTYKIYHTQDRGWLKHNFWSEHVLTYRIVEFLHPAIKINFPPCDDLKQVLKAGKSDLENKTIFF